MATSDESTENGALSEIYGQFHQFETIDAANLGDAPFAVVPEGKKLESVKRFIDEHRALPDRRRGTAQLRDVESFVAIVERFKSAESIVYASPDRRAPSVTAVFDYSPRGADATKADWHKHRAVYAPQLSDEWTAWMAKNNQWMTQADFAAFIEEHVTDLISPKLDDPKIKLFADLVEGVWASPSDMVALSRGLQVNVSSAVKNAQNLNTGEVSLVFEEQHRDAGGQTLKIATLFVIVVPVFYAGALYRISARIRYRVKDGSILWLYQLVRPELVFDHAFNGERSDPTEEPSIVVKIREETQLPVLLGTPEQ